jgi:hypothetical protein
MIGGTAYGRMNKQHILNEIQRTARENGGPPLGVDRFSQETGIKHDDWFGKYWARWSDAVKEAGLVPNKWSTEGYPEDVLLEKYAGLVREHGKPPSRGEIGLKRRTDSSFPSEKAFRRLGSRAQLLSKVREYCAGHSGFQDVLEFCQPVAQIGDNETGPEQDEIPKATGVVYLMKSGRHYKIGKTNAIGRREYELAIQLPAKAQTVHVITALDDPSGIEAYWHTRFAAKRANGEWFELDAADVRAFKRRKFM